jgi:hypothetical protein
MIICLGFLLLMLYCQSELKFAKQCGVPIVPINVGGGQWRATGWLGVSSWRPLTSRFGLVPPSHLLDPVQVSHRM